MLRRTAVLPAAAVALAVLLGSCASEPDTPSPAEQTSAASQAAAEVDPAKVDDALPVTVTGDLDPAVAPAVDFAKPLTVTETTRKVVAAGTGEEVGADDEVRFAYALYAGPTGELLDSSYGKTDLRIEVAQVTKGIARGVLGAHVGDRLAIAIAPEDGFGEAVTQFGKPGVDATSTVVLVADITGVVPTIATGEAVTPPAGLPTVVLDDAGVPQDVEVTDTAPPADTVAQTLIEGTGPVVTSGMQVKMQYVGATLADGEVFESSWESGNAFETVIGQGQVIAGWDKGIPGQTVGSRVLLVIPAADAYGDAPTGGQPAGALVFVVDILDAY
ncbi:FKBP-type peptidyl-prolyl cis-trans isomerase [Kineococcus indalonis]|uniref:FKBP-type peptidyl-prolyl cis-trans isomerase n=1 Tax=Kineococcus indalonis TaxID=2696566 RepID=UPI0014132944|nr:FKBP-type peptidyl-prolyl cis-trans isomerase [Kineococcus indalonis]NAZ86030.1 FKBP-type peptidylprolyl isomerase [Kineococcus indalonis]